MNSSNLQTLFTKEYEDFFSTNNLVISSPHIINRGDITSLEGINIKIAQKLPTRVYIGINMRKDKDIQFKTITRFVNAEQKFEEKNIETETSKETNEKMKNIIQEKLSEYGCMQGFDMTVLSENERGTGIASYSVRALLIAFVIHVLGKKILPSQLDDYPSFIRSKEFKEIYMTAKEIMTAIWDIPKEQINTTILFTAAIDNGNIGIGLENKEYLRSHYPKTRQLENNICLEHFNMDSKKIMEYSIINFGGFFQEFYNRETYLHEQEIYDNILKEYNMYKKKTTAHIDMMNILYLKVVKSIKNAISHPNNDSFANDFFVSINKIGTYQTLIEESMDLYKDIITSFKKNTMFEDEKIGLIPISSAKPGGTFLCITKAEKSRETLRKTINDLHKNGHTTVNVQYLSREDGTSEETIKIEQFLSEKIYSRHIQKESVLLKQWHSEEKKIGIHNDLLSNLPEGIVFDTIEKKIYIKKKSITHKDLCTQSGTVEIMDIVCGKSLHEKQTNNKELAISSYSKNRNEMVGKIILPLQKLVEKTYKKKFPIKCRGSITNFDIILEKSPIPIYFISEIHEEAKE